jgi:hypothetical protein
MAVRSSSLFLLAAFASACSEAPTESRDTVDDTGLASAIDSEATASDALSADTTAPDTTSAATDAVVGSDSTTTTCPVDDFTKPFDSIPSEFDINTELLPAAVPPSADPDTVGAFRLI